MKLYKSFPGENNYIQGQYLYRFSNHQFAVWKKDSYEEVVSFGFPISTLINFFTIGGRIFQ